MMQPGMVGGWLPTEEALPSEAMWQWPPQMAFTVLLGIPSATVTMPTRGMQGTVGELEMTETPCRSRDLQVKETFLYHICHLDR